MKDATKGTIIAITRMIVSIMITIFDFLECKFIIKVHLKNNVYERNYK